MAALIPNLKVGENETRTSLQKSFLQESLKFVGHSLSKLTHYLISLMKEILPSILLLLMFATSSLAQVPDCKYATPCEAYAHADAVFVAKVIKIVPETTEIWQRDKDYDQTTTVLIEKIYKGRKRNRLVFHQLGRKVAPKFVLGSRYLFYANFDRATKSWEVKPCGSTRMVEYANDDLHYLDGLPASLKTTRIAGEVVRYEKSADNPQGTSEGLAGIKLRVIGNGKQYEVVMDADGMYAVYGAPAGSYTIQPEIPPGLTLLSVMHYGFFDRSTFRSLTIELKEGACSGAGIMLTTDRTTEQPKGFTHRSRAGMLNHSRNHRRPGATAPAQSEWSRNDFRSR